MDRSILRLPCRGVRSCKPEQENMYEENMYDENSLSEMDVKFKFIGSYMSA